MNSDGSGQTDLNLLTNAPDLRPAWSPDGTRIAYQHNEEIHVVGADGAGDTVIYTQATGGIEGLSWSPDGTKIAMGVNDNSGGCGIWTINAGGGGLTRITAPDCQTVVEVLPSWSADGQTIVFSSNRNTGPSGGPQLFTVWLGQGNPVTLLNSYISPYQDDPPDCRRCGRFDSL